MKPIPGGQACGFAALRGLSAAPLVIKNIICHKLYPFSSVTTISFEMDSN
jgi:hypothetical protein